MNDADRNLAAELRGLEEGHRAYVQPGGWVKVVSDTFHDKWYRVDVMVNFAGDPITFLCQPEGANAYQEDHKVSSPKAGVVGCKHAAVAARRMEREGLAHFDGDHWKATEKLRIRPAPMQMSDDELFDL